MELSSQISELQSKYEALSLILSGICNKVAEITQYRDLMGTETFARLIEWQSNINAELMAVQAEMQNYFQKIDQIRQTLMGIPILAQEDDSMESESRVDKIKLMDEDAARSTDPDDFLVVENPELVSTFHLQVKKNGVYSRGLCAAAWAALFSSGGHMGNKYAGPKIAEAKKKLKAIYKKMGWEMPRESK